MKRSLVIFAGLMTLTAALAASSSVLALSTSSAATATEQASSAQLPPAIPAGQMSFFGHIKTLTRKGGHYEMRFDPAWFTSGITANTAAAEDGVIRPGEAMPNDNYVVEGGHRLLTYIVPGNARVTVLTNNGTGILSTPIAVSELARIINGGKHRKLFEPLSTGVWIRVQVDTVRSLDQQYHP